MDVVRLINEKVLLLTEKILKVLEGDNNYLTFESELKKELDNLGGAILKAVLESLEEKLRESEDRKQHWKIVRRNDRKEILTPFGPVVYKRSYYRHKENKQYAYLVDKKAGITPHARVGANLKAHLAETSTGISYEKTTEEVSRYNTDLKVSKQTVASCVKNFKPKTETLPEKKKLVTNLYIEADEDHLKLRGRKSAQARLIYIHEGVEQKPRRHLKNAKYFTTISKNPEEFWLEVCDYIDAHYELSSIKTIFLSGDGNSWIKVGLEYIPGSKYILDKFHLAKYILTATAHATELRKPIYRSINRLNKQEVLSYLEKALERAEKPPKQKKIQKTVKYIKNNWDGIESSVKYPHVGCSAEGHVSHILSARLSNRPMAWSLQGAEKMASMRAIQANGESISEHYLASLDSSTSLVELKETVQKELKRVQQKQSQCRENFNNVPLFRAGRNLTRMALKGLNARSII